MSNLQLFHFDTQEIRNESALTFVVSRSRTETGKRLNQWIHCEVLPSIRKTGSYTLPLTAQSLLPSPVLDKKKTKKGFVYILVDKANKAFKIGFTTNLDSRLRNHKTSNPFLKLMKAYEVTSMGVETAIHERLASYRITGTTEWYHKCPEVLNIVDLVCSPNQ